MAMVLSGGRRQRQCHRCQAFIAIKNGRLKRHRRPMFRDSDGSLIYGSLADRKFMETHYPNATWVGGGICVDL